MQPATEPTRYGDDSIIPDEDLEFNADSTDLNKVFVEQPPSPQFTAATGTFKAIRLEAQEPSRTEELSRTDEREIPQEEPFDPIDTQVDVEIDPDLLATMAQLTSNRLERLNPTPPEPEPREFEPREFEPREFEPREFEPREFAPPPQSAPPQQQQRKPAKQPPPPATTPAPPQDARASHGTPSPSTTGTFKAAKANAPAKQPMLLQPPVEQPPQPAVPMRLAERAKARADAAADTTQAIRAALAPRKRASVSDLATEQPTPFFAGMWAAGSLLLLLLLTIQVVHHYRHDLAANATLNGPLTSIYAVLGIPLVPRWDLTAYEVRQLGASTAADAPGQITVRASVKNNARQPQPLPLLRVTLQDRFGNRIASRDVPPQSYLPRAIPSSSLLSSGQRIDAEMAFVDPGSNAVGFEIDACLPAPGGGISCANDAAR